MTVQEAIQNIETVVSDTRMTRQEHAVLQQNIALVIKRCQLADELEKKEPKKE